MSVLPSLGALTRPAANLALEAAAVGQAAALYAAGLSDRVCDRLAAPRRPLADHPLRPYPVLLLHGIWHNQAWAVRLERTLAEQGYACWSVNYRTVGCTIDDAAVQVAQFVRVLAEQHQAERVHVVGHSLAGLVLRAAAQRHGVGDRLGAAVTLGTPHGGSPLAVRQAHRLPAVGPLVAQVAVGSAFLAELDAATTGPGSARWSAVYSPADEVVPGRRGRLDLPALGARNVEIPDVGHIAMMFDPRVAAAVREALAAVDATA